MTCPICGAPLQAQSDHCPSCGCRFVVSPQWESPPPRPRPRRRRNILGFLAIGLLCLTFVIGAGIGIVSLISGPESSLPEPPSGTTESGDDIIESGSHSVVTDDGCFRVKDGVLTFLAHEYEGGTVLRVPETVDGQTVTAIATGCFARCPNLTTIILPDTIQSIGPNAFLDCTNLRGMNLPEGTTTIGAGAFDGCINLEAIYIPGGIQSIAEGTLEDCAKLRYIFYNGTFEQWNLIYPHYVTPFTYAICTDGEYYHGTGL